MAEPSGVYVKLYDLPYGVIAKVHDSENCFSKRQTLYTPLYYSLPLSKVAKFVEFARFLFF